MASKLSLWFRFETHGLNEKLYVDSHSTRKVYTLYIYIYRIQ